MPIVERRAAQGAVGRILLFGGIGALLLIGILALLKLPAKARVVVPSLAIAAAINYVGVKPGAMAQNVLTVLKLSGLAMLVGAGLFMGLPEGASETALIVTHDLDFAQSVSDLIAVLIGGRIAQVGPPEAIRHSTLPEVQAFMAGKAP